MVPSFCGSQLAPKPGPLSLPLVKLSFCTTSTLRANLLWSHLPYRDDLFAVFDVISYKDLGGCVSEKRVLKLFRGGEILVCLFESDVFGLYDLPGSPDLSDSVVESSRCSD